MPLYAISLTDLYHHRKIRKCKYCNSEVKRNIRPDGRNKGFYHTCGSKKCILMSQCTPEAIAKKKHVGENHPRWIKDRSKVKFRPRYEMTIWRNLVFERDNYICQLCGVRGGKLQADHIKPYSIFPELRWNIDNRRTLCFNCHKNTKTYARRFKNKEDFYAFC